MENFFKTTQESMLLLQKINNWSCDKKKKAPITQTPTHHNQNKQSIERRIG
jgi:hypothetical protein